MRNNSNLDQIYKKRFQETGLQFRNEMWKILVVNFFQKYFKKTDVVLDMPCGYCEFINNIKAGKKIAIDLNRDSKKYAKKNVKFLKTSSDKTTLDDSSVDKIFISNFFEHLTRDEIIKTLIECKRILTAGGQVLVLQPNIRFCAKDYWMFFDHVTPIDDRALDEAFTTSGFRLIDKIEKFLPYSTKSSLPKSKVLINIYLKLPFLWYFFGRQSFMIYEKQSF